MLTTSLVIASHKRLLYLNIFNSSGQSVRKFKLNRRTYYPNQEFTEMIFAPSLSSFINQAASARLEPCEYYAFLNYAGTVDIPKKIDEQKKSILNEINLI